MHIDLRTVSIQPLRQTFDHLARRFGDKPSSRYQEGSYDIQPVENLHYRPTWDPDQTLYDASVTQIVMSDWYVLKDPRQFYYSTYTLARARQQETTEANFNFVETRGLVDLLPDALRQRVLNLLVPLRHAAWGANLNNTFICSYGYGTVFTQPCMYHAMDNLGIAQYLSRIGLLLGATEALDAGKAAWMEGRCLARAASLHRGLPGGARSVRAVCRAERGFGRLAVPAGVPGHRRRSVRRRWRIAGGHAHPVHERLVR
jgi:phenol hydroxylase P1 protein